ncbi:MAG: hypothetical protein N2234_02985 [Planctomycetota bacterium]|nr:hypothetical protein [Planctomycetota bacterium]
MEVSADLHPCFACGARLTLSTNVRADCSNPGCAGGKVFTVCGFCKKYSFSVGQSYCFNPNCRLYKIKRTICPICNKMAVITHHGRPVCINRSCESNRKVVTTCFFCGNASFLKSPGTMFCTKSDCKRLLQTTGECFACKQLSYVQSESKCKNPSCKYYDVEIAQCSSCRQTSFVTSSNHPHTRRCLNPACSLYYEKGEKSIPTDQLRREQLGKMLQDTMAIPVEELQKQHQVSAPVPSAKDVEPELFGKTFAQHEDEASAKEKPLEVSVEPVTDTERAAEKAEKKNEVKPVVEPIPAEKGQPLPQTPKPFVSPTPLPVEETHQPVPVVSPPQKVSKDVLNLNGETIGMKQPPPPKTPAEAQKKPALQEEDIADKLFRELSGEEMPKTETESIPTPTDSKKPLLPQPPKKIEKKSEEGRPVVQEQMIESEPKGSKDVVEPIQKDEEWEMESVPYQSGQSVAPIRQSAVPLGVSGSITIEEIYKFFDEHILHKDSSSYNPLFLVMGLPGSGKTTYLTMLGAILLFRNTMFRFPYPNLTPALVNVEAIAKKVFGKSAAIGQKQLLLQVLKSHVVDLVAGFAQDNFNRYIKQRLFPPQTPPSVSDRITGMFLVTELQKAGRSVARIATLEISGEDVKEVLKQIKEAEPEKILKTPEQRVFYKMLNKASGFIILTDPASPENDVIYNNFFWVLEEVLLSRFKKRLSELVLQRLHSSKGSSATQRLKLNEVMEILEHVEREQKKVELATAERQRLKEQYQERLKEVLQAMQEKGGEKVITEKKWKEFLGELDSLLFEEAFPQQRKEWRDILNEKLKTLKSPQEQLSLLALYLFKVADYCMKHIDELIDKQPEEVVRRLNEQMRRAEVERAKREVFEEFQIPEEFEFYISGVEGGEEPHDVERFANLKFISIVITKSDTNRIIYPPENFAAQKMPLSARHLDKIQQYLKLFNGHVRYYNASVTGYSIMMDTTSYIGPECTLTPINVLEPVFDMLQAEGIIDGG